MRRIADSLKTVLQQRKSVAGQVEGILDARPLAAHSARQFAERLSAAFVQAGSQEALP
jgi:hypothetical protein